MNSCTDWQKHSFVTSVVLFLIFPSCITNQMDPHVYPKVGPFFEGWYLRIIDTEQNISLGFLYGRVLPTPIQEDQIEIPFYPDIPPLNPLHVSEPEPRCGNVSDSPPLVVLSLLLSLEPQEKLDIPVGYFDPKQYNITKNGKPIVTNPDDKTPPQFEARVARNLTYIVNPQGTVFNVTVGNHILYGETSHPVSWGPNGKGPESWLKNLPLPFHWFVYSLRSTVKFYEYTNKETGRVIYRKSTKENPIIAHLEKNWGRSFPKAWIWSEGVDSDNGVTFAFSAGLVTELGIDIKAQLSGYRNPRKEIDCSFNPSNSFHSLDFSGCDGSVILKVIGIDCSVIFQVIAQPESFSSCLPAPMADGFKKGCVESFTAIANITVYQGHSLHMILTDTQTVHFSALEFGGKYMCNGHCPAD